MIQRTYCSMRIWLPLILLVVFAMPSHAQKKKNVLFIAIDDLKPLLNCYGNEHVHSPNIDALAARGILFRNAHCQQALCGPSRLSLLTGLYPDTLGIYGMGSKRYEFRPKHPDMITLPQHFKNNGYETIGTGKIYDPRNVEVDQSGRPDPDSWTKFASNPVSKNAGTKTRMYQDPEVRELAAKLTKEAKAKGLADRKLRYYVRERGGGPAVECFDVPDEGYRDGAIANYALEQLDELKDSQKPFFLAVGFVKPHLPFVAPKKYWDLYDRDKLEIAPFQVYPQGAPDCAETAYVEARTYSGVPMDGPIAKAKQQELIHGYLACVSYVDAQIGKLIAKLKETGLDDNTVIVLWGDHGFHLGDKQLWGKHTTYEQSTHAPLIFAGKGVPAGKSNPSPVNFVDIYPTICELTAQDTPQGLDGKSLMPIFSDSTESVNEFAASIYPHEGKWGIAIRTERYRYVTWYDGKLSKDWQGIRLQDEPQFTELYDYQADPLERKNLSGDPEYAKAEIGLAKLNRRHVVSTQKGQRRTDR